LFEEASAVIPEAQQSGLVGQNGAGKTTLFKIIRGELSLERRPTISCPQRAKIGGQIAQRGGRRLNVSLIETFWPADVERGRLNARAEHGRPRAQSPRWQTPFADIDAWSAEGRAPRSSKASL